MKKNTKNTAFKHADLHPQSSRHHAHIPPIQDAEQAFHMTHGDIFLSFWTT
jgi:hypothetical protein